MPFLMMSNVFGLHAFVVPAAGGERADLRAIAANVHELGAVLERAEHFLRRRDEARAGVVRLVAHRAIELRRMRDRLVDREPEVRRMQHEIVAADVDRLRRELLHRFFGPLRRVLDEVRVAHVLVAESARRDVDRLARLEVAVARRR